MGIGLRINKKSGIVFAVGAGIFGALSANAAKLTVFEKVPWVLAGSAMVLLNVAGTVSFSSALGRTTSLHATAISVATNALSSGLIGYIVYMEKICAKWLVGVFCLALGAVLVQPKDQSPVIAASQIRPKAE